jgi:glycosyltransferase involved in cell wall biosynthesis
MTSDRPDVASARATRHTEEVGDGVEGSFLRCLLFSPVSPPDPRNGDSQYTEDLVRVPPDRVEYVRYTDALDSGEIEWGPSLRALRTWRSPFSRLPAATVRAALHLGRRLGLLLEDPVRWLRINGGFDLVHVQCMPVRFLGPRPPVLLSDSAGTFWYWSAGRGIAESRVLRLLRREHVVARLVGYLHPTANPAGDGLIFFIQAGVSLAARIGINASSAVICAPGVPSAHREPFSDGRTLLFVGRDFTLKGGPDALRVFERVRTQIPDARLIVAGPERPPTVPEGVEWLGPLARETLYDQVYPRADAFLYPTRFDCAPFVVQEALANGLPILAPRIMGMPDLVRHAQTGYLFEPGNIEEAASAAVELLQNPNKLTAMRAAARADFEQRFSIPHRNEVLGAVYRSLVR